MSGLSTLKDRLFISFSGGRTSAYMTKRLLDEYRGKKEIVVLFANTGKEREETLRFVDRCDRDFGFNVVWLEAVVHPQKGIGTTHRIVNFDSAARAGEPFEAAIQKYGVPNKHYPHCTRELKQRPMFSFIRSLGWKPGTFSIAIGIRHDEIDRAAVNASDDGIIYPLIYWKISKEKVLAWWREQPFSLYLPEHLGNCDFCWKKSLRKHLTLARDYRGVFTFPAEMEDRYPHAGPGDHDGPRHFFRGNRSALDILTLADQPFEPFVDANQVFDPALDVGDGCEESCEVFTADFMSDLIKNEGIFG